MPSIEKRLLEIAADYGFSSAFGGVVPELDASPADLKAAIFFQHQPCEWAERYIERGYVYRDPVVRQLRQVRSSFSWQEAYDVCETRDDVALIQGEASDFGLRAGHVIPISTLDGTLAAVSFGGADCDVSPEDCAVLGFATSYAIGSFLHFRERRRQMREKLSTREHDCLLWSAEGKTDWEISVILGISKSTVAKHTTSARLKLGAATKSHAVALALRAKLFR